MDECHKIVVIIFINNFYDVPNYFTFPSYYIYSADVAAT